MTELHSGGKFFGKHLNLGSKIVCACTFKENINETKNKFRIPQSKKRLFYVLMPPNRVKSKYQEKSRSIYYCERSE